MLYIFWDTYIFDTSFGYNSHVLRCKVLSISGIVSPKRGEFSSLSGIPAISVLAQDVDITVMKEPASFYFRNTPEYVVHLSPLDTVILVNIRGWNFCNLTHGKPKKSLHFYVILIKNYALECFYLHFLSVKSF